VNAQRFPGVVAAQRDGRVLADNAAGAQVPAETIAAMSTFLAEDNAQKGSLFPRAERTSALIARAKATFAELIGVAAQTVGIGLNATSLAFAFARNLAHIIKPGDRIVVTAADHYANIAPWAWLKRFGATLEIVPVDAHGDIDEAAFHAALAQEPVLVALPWGSNATGTLFDVARFARAAGAAGAIVVVDGVQAAPHVRIDMPSAVDFAFFSAYKIFAPHAGMFYTKPEAAARFYRADDPFLPSDPIYWALEIGTQAHESWAGWLGTIAYLRSIANGDLRAAMDEIARSEADLTRYALDRFAERADRIQLLGRPTTDTRLPVFAFNMPGQSPHDIARSLAKSNIEARVGDYYSPRLLQALAPDFGNAAVRLSFAHYTTRDDVDTCLTALDRLATVKSC